MSHNIIKQLLQNTVLWCIRYVDKTLCDFMPAGSYLP